MAKLSSIRGMQDAREKDMFHLSNTNYLRYNGHAQVSSPGKSGGGKKERKGCTKGKIEAVMRNSSFGPSIISSNQANMTVTTIPNSLGNNFLRTNHATSKQDQEDPYTFTDAEPHVQYPGPSVKKPPLVVKVSSATSTSPVAKPEPLKAPSVFNRHKPVDNLSKMNKLQADFARNKLMGKRRKVDQPQSVSTQVQVSTAAKWEPRKRENHRVLIASKKVARKTSWQRERKARHELLERIEEAKNEWDSLTQDIYPLGLEISDSDDDSENSMSIYERDWFHCPNGSDTREGRVCQTRSELRRELAQVIRGVSTADSAPSSLLSAVISAARRFPNATALLLDPNPPPLTPSARYVNKISRGGRFLVRGEKCSHWEGCNFQSLPCTRHCANHIMTNVDQRLFSRCTAKAPDNTQCNVPVFDVLHHLPLCPVHASKHDNFKAFNENKQKKVSKKSRVLGLSRSNKRSQKKKKKSTDEVDSPSVVERPAVDEVRPPPQPPIQPEAMPVVVSPVEPPPPPPPPPIDPITVHIPDRPPPPTPIVQPSPHLPEVDGEVSEEVLAIASLDPVELASQATRLLEEHDLTNVLNQISPDAFNDLFAEDKNGGYEPTREETEELDRALEAVDNDVRSLEERMTRSVPLLPSLLPLVDSFLEDHSLSVVFPPPPPFPTDIQPS